MRTLILVCCAAAMLASCASKPDPALEAKLRKERAEEQRTNAAKADAELRRAVKSN